VNVKKSFLLGVLAAMLLTASEIRTAATGDYMMYVGTYTGGGSKGIYAYRFNPQNGKKAALGLVAESINPSFLAVSPDHLYLYAVNEFSNFEGKNGGVSSFAINPRTGALSFLNKVSSGGSDPCHLTIDPFGKWLFVANYSSGNVAVLPITVDGRLGKASSLIQHSGSGKDPRRQAGPHAHSVALSPDSRFLLVCDLSLDKVMIYRFDLVKGTLKANDPAFIKLNPGSGPRHLFFNPNGQFVYGINELSSTLTAFAYDSDRGSLREIETISTLPGDFSGENIAAEIEVHAEGRFVYASNRGHDSIAVFAIKAGKSIVEPVEYVSTQGKTPRHFAIDPTGNYLFAANQNSGEVIVFRIDRETGKLTATGQILKIPNPACILFIPQFGINVAQP
jgi:6-phosphogluconolactonase